MNIIVILIIFIIVSLFISYINPVRRRKSYYYNLALQKSIETNKPLLVIGDPENGSSYNRHVIYRLFGVPYGYGDLCIDLSGCPKNNISKSIKGKVENILPYLLDNSYVIFTSQLIEYVDHDKIDNVINDLIRVSNGDLFIVNMKYKGDTYLDNSGIFVPKNYIIKAPPEFDYIEYSKYSDESEQSKIVKVK